MRSFIDSANGPWSHITLRIIIGDDVHEPVITALSTRRSGSLHTYCKLWRKHTQTQRHKNKVPLLPRQPSITLFTADNTAQPYSVGYGRSQQGLQGGGRVNIIQGSTKGLCRVLHKLDEVAGSPSARGRRVNTLFLVRAIIAPWLRTPIHPSAPVTTFPPPLLPASTAMQPDMSLISHP